MTMQSMLRRSAEPNGQDIIRAGNLEVRLAETAQEIDAAQALRYRVFYDEMGATPSPATAAARRDRDLSTTIATTSWSSITRAPATIR